MRVNPQGKKSQSFSTREDTTSQCKCQPAAQCDRRARGLSGRGRSRARLMGA